MVYFSFFMILAGLITFIISLVALIFRLVGLGSWNGNDLYIRQIIKIGAVGGGLTLLGQIIIRLAL